MAKKINNKKDNKSRLNDNMLEGMTREVQQLDINKVHPSKMNHRKVKHDENLMELASSIKNHGLFQPIVVRPMVDNKNEFEIIMGERRYTASKIAEMKYIEAKIVNITDYELYVFSLSENVLREDPNPIEIAKAYNIAILMKREEAKENNEEQSITDFAKDMGIPRTTVTNTLRLLQLDNDIQDMIENKEISGAAGKEIAAQDFKMQHKIIDYVRTHNNEKYTVANIRNAMNHVVPDRIAQQKEKKRQALAEKELEHKMWEAKKQIEEMQKTSKEDKTIEEVALDVIEDAVKDDEPIEYSNVDNIATGSLDAVRFKRDMLERRLENLLSKEVVIDDKRIIINTKSFTESIELAQTLIDKIKER